MKKIILFASLFSLSVQAVIPAGAQNLRLAHSIGRGDDIFLGDDKKTIKEATSGGFEKFDVSSTLLTSSWGIGGYGQVDVGLIYSHLDVGTKELGGVSELATHYRHDLFTKYGVNVEGGLGFRTPGNDRTGDTFASFNDGQIKYDYLLDFEYSPVKWVTVSLMNRFTDRAAAGSKSQRLHELGASFKVIDTTYVRPFYQLFSTRAGRDISDNDFADRFSEVKEKWNAIGLTVGHQLNKSLGFDVSYFSRLTSGARNTNVISGFTVGVNYSI